MHKLGELLFFLNFDGSVEGMKITFHLDLLHVQVKDFPVIHMIVAHVHSFTEFTLDIW